MHLVFELMMFALLATPGGTHSSLSVQGETMGTTYMVRVEGESLQFTEASLKTAIDERLVRINKLMSTYDPESELSRFNTSENTDWFEVSPETVVVVDKALEISKLSQGAFDPTVGKLVRLWSFGSGARVYEPPSDEVISEALKSVGWELVEVRTAPPSLKKQHANVELDLSAIAKGYGVDQVAVLLESQQVESYMVEIGGEVRAKGSINGHPWRIGIERPEALNMNRQLESKVELDNQALATSGDYRNYFEKDGIKYSHTINPRTGKPVTHALASVSVVAEDCMTADALATTLMVLGPDQGLAFSNEQNVSAYFLSRNTSATVSETFIEATSQAAHQMFVHAAEIDQAESKPKPANLLTTFLITLIVFGIAIIGLAAGVLLSNKELKGSCGGVEGTKDAQGKSICDLCTTPPEECDRVKEEIAKAMTKK